MLFRDVEIPRGHSRTCYHVFGLARKDFFFFGSILHSADVNIYIYIATKAGIVHARAAFCCRRQEMSAFLSRRGLAS